MAGKNEDDLNRCDLEPNTHEMFRFDRESSKKLKGGGVL